MDRRFGDGLLKDDPFPEEEISRKQQQQFRYTHWLFSWTRHESDTTSPSRIFGTAVSHCCVTRIREIERPWKLLVGLVIASAVCCSVVWYTWQQQQQQQHYFQWLKAFSTTAVIRVAFLGNSITFVNDLPRFMEALSHRRILQNSCLHGSLNLASILSKGNGMYNKWQTSSAYIDNSNNNAAYLATTTMNDDASTTETMALYDFGACTFPQLLLGYDELLMEANSNGYYTNDGMNPCFQDTNYLMYLTQQSPLSVTNNQPWDYVVMNDQTVQPAIPRRRKRSLRALQRVYAGLLNQTSAIPVFLSTYGYDKSLYDDEDEEDAPADEADDDEYDAVDDNGNATAAASQVYESLGDIPEFTSRVWYGYQQYATKLGSYLPSQQQPILVPSALAFLTIWEDNYDAWLQLFYDDGFHPSPHGTYLLGCCLYASLYRRMPPTPPRRDRTQAAALFERARRMHMDSMGDDRPFPTYSEAAYLASVAKRVVLDGHVPASLLPYQTIAQMEADEAASNR